MERSEPMRLDDLINEHMTGIYSPEQVWLDWKDWMECSDLLPEANHTVIYTGRTGLGLPSSPTQAFKFKGITFLRKSNEN